MRYYKDSRDGSVFAFESEEERQIYGSEFLVEMTQEEIDQHLGIPSNDPNLEYRNELSILNRNYQSDVEVLNKAFSTAYLADGPSQDTKQNSIRSQYYVRKNKYAADYLALRLEYGV